MRRYLLKLSAFVFQGRQKFDQNPHGLLCTCRFLVNFFLPENWRILFQKMFNKGKPSLISLFCLVVFISFLSFDKIVLADSVMLSPAELDAIGMTTEEAKSSQQGVLLEKSGQKIRLDGIVYHNDDNWYIWLNGQRFSQGQQPTHYKIIKVRHDRIEIIEVTQDDLEAKPIVLSLGQIH